MFTNEVNIDKSIDSYATWDSKARSYKIGQYRDDIPRRRNRTVASNATRIGIVKKIRDNYKVSRKRNKNNFSDIPLEILVT